MDCLQCLTGWNSPGEGKYVYEGGAGFHGLQTSIKICNAYKMQADYCDGPLHILCLQLCGGGHLSATHTPSRRLPMPSLQALLEGCSLTCLPPLLAQYAHRIEAGEPWILVECRVLCLCVPGPPLISCVAQPSCDVGDHTLPQQEAPRHGRLIKTKVVTLAGGPVNSSLSS
jgi:hypothetical protein